MVITSFDICYSNVAYNTVAQHIAIQAIQHKFGWTGRFMTQRWAAKVSYPKNGNPNISQSQ